VFCVDHLPDRLERVAALGAVPVNFDEADPVTTLKERTGQIGVLRAIDAVGVDAVRPDTGPAYAASRLKKSQFEEEQKEVQLEGSGETWRGQWKPGDAPSQVLQWAVQAVAKAGTLSVIGVYPETMTRFPIGMAMLKNLTLQMGNCPHRHYIPRLLELVQSGQVDPTRVTSHIEPMTDVIEAYKAFDKRRSGWVKVELKPTTA
jgi:threonine dehydrogenase-like Zn-dependent dehydrogenase